MLFKEIAEDLYNMTRNAYSIYRQNCLLHSFVADEPTWELFNNPKSDFGREHDRIESLLSGCLQGVFEHIMVLANETIELEEKCVRAYYKKEGEDTQRNKEELDKNFQAAIDRVLQKKASINQHSLHRGKFTLKECGQPGRKLTELDADQEDLAIQSPEERAVELKKWVHKNKQENNQYSFKCDRCENVPPDAECYWIQGRLYKICPHCDYIIVGMVNHKSKT